MGLFDFLPFTEKDGSESNEAAEKNTVGTYMEGAERAANIISQGIDIGDISGITVGLADLSNSLGAHDRYVFKPFKKLGTKKKILSYAILSLPFLYFVILFYWTARYSDELQTWGTGGLVLSMLVILANIALIGKAVSEDRFMKRYARYYKELRFKKTELTDNLTDTLSINSQSVIQDLKRAVREKLIPHGHFGHANKVFMVSDQMYSEYISRQADYDRYYDQKLAERKRAKERTPEIEDVLRKGQEYIAQIHKSNDIIKDKGISDKLDRMEDIVTAIFHEVDLDPSQAKNLGMFIDYYLPTTGKLLETYIDMDEKTVKGKNIKKMQKEIAEALGSINNAFECLLEKFYDEKEMDIASEIKVMGAVMKQDGLQDSKN